MKTLIELYDERPIENVLATEVFKPERTVFLCPRAEAADTAAQDKLRAYFRHRGIDTELIFLDTAMFISEKVAARLKQVIKTYPDCVLDVTGGTDAALFAGGMVCDSDDMPAFTYSWKKKRFYSIRSAPFGDELKCELEHNVEDCFLMAGGAMRKGRVDNAVLAKYLDSFDGFFSVYLEHRRDWTRAVNYIQRASQGDRNAPVSLHVDAPYTVKGERGSRIDVPKDILSDLVKLGYISDLRISPQRVSFDFKDEQIRTWLRDIGSVLELYVYKACLDTGIFNDVITSAVVDWEGDFRRDNVTNEIDVMAMQGTIPAFISCKTCDVSTEALNELAILRARFGGEAARAAIVTAQRCRNITRHRAWELGIDVIDLDDLKAGRIKKHIQSMMR